MAGQPGHRFGVKALHGDLWQQLFKLKPKMTNPTVGKDNICIQNFTRQRVYTTRTDRCTNIIVQPAYKVITDVFWILVHVGASLLILVVDFNCAGNTDFLKGSVPRQDTFAHPPAITDWCRVLNVKHDRILRRTDLQRRISFFKMPAVDITNPCLLIGVLTVITVRCCKVPNSLVRFSWFIRRLGGNLANGIVQRLQLAPARRYFKGNFHVLRKSLHLFD